MRSRTSALQTQPPSDPQLTHTVSQIEASLVSLRAELASLENRLHQTRGEYGRVLHYLNEVKAQLAMQQTSATDPLPIVDEMELETCGDDDWDHLIKQITSL